MLARTQGTHLFHLTMFHTYMLRLMSASFTRAGSCVDRRIFVRFTFGWLENYEFCKMCRFLSLFHPSSPLSVSFSQKTELMIWFDFCCILRLLSQLVRCVSTICLTEVFSVNILQPNFHSSKFHSKFHFSLFSMGVQHSDRNSFTFSIFNALCASVGGSCSVVCVRIITANSEIFVYFHSDGCVAGSSFIIYNGLSVSGMRACSTLNQMDSGFSFLNFGSRTSNSRTENFRFAGRRGESDIKTHTTHTYLRARTQRIQNRNVLPQQ